MPDNGHEQFEQTVRGSGGTLRTNATGVMETDNYAYAGDFELSGGQTLNPNGVIQELTVTQIGDQSLVLKLHTVGGDVVDYPHRGGTFVHDKMEIDSVEVEDPQGTGATITGVWVGE